ncbi:MAG: hypothetical protein HY892_06460 [Deltaproteobacteria bacterium]|nr:hypothetical protein [Deltaproteobacteria bacterium]
MERTWKILGAGCLFLLLLTGARAWGDASVETFFKTGGFKGMGAAEGMTTHRYQGEKKWESGNLQFTGAILSRLAGPSETVTITRVDQGVYWNLDPKNKTYTETPIKPLKLEPEDKPKREEKPEKQTTRITKSEFSVKKTGAAETINGFSCEEYLVTWLLEFEDLETKAKSRSTMQTNIWTTPETATIKKVQSEEQQFNQALAKKLVSDISMEDARQMGLAAMMSMSRASQEDIKKGLVQVKNEMAKIKGYPIRTVISWNVEGDSREGGARKEAREEPTDISSGVGGILSGLLGKAVQKKVEEKAAGGQGAPFFSSTTEVKSLNADGVPAANFEIPAGYVKK